MSPRACKAPVIRLWRFDASPLHVLAYSQCRCTWQDPTQGRCRCSHNDTDHDAGQCWANALNCPDCGSSQWNTDDMGGVHVMRCFTCGYWDPKEAR